MTVLKEIFSHIHTESWFGPQLCKHSRTSITLFIYLCSFLPSGLIFISITNFPEHIFVLLAVHFTAFPEFSGNMTETTVCEVEGPLTKGVLCVCRNLKLW